MLGLEYDEQMKMLDIARSRDKCGTGSLLTIHPDTGERIVMPLRCKTWDCPKCSKTMKMRWIKRIQSARPTRWFTLTMKAELTGSTIDQFRTLQTAWKALVAIIRKRFGSFEYVCVRELQKRGAPHIHSAFRGAFIPQKWLSRTWVKLGGGPIVHIQAIQGDNRLASYITKDLVKTFPRARRIDFRYSVVSSSRNFFPPTPPSENDMFEERFHWSFMNITVAEYCQIAIEHDGATIVELGEDGSVILTPETGWYQALEDDLPLVSSTGTKEEQLDLREGPDLRRINRPALMPF